MIGVSQGFTLTLELKGIGYQVQLVEDGNLIEPTTTKIISLLDRRILELCNGFHRQKGTKIVFDKQQTEKNISIYIGTSSYTSRGVQLNE